MGLGATQIVGAAVTLGAVWAFAPGCGGSTRSDGTEAPPDCPPGSESCSCLAGEECNDALRCPSGTCVAVDEDAGQEQFDDAGQPTELPCPELVALAESRLIGGVCDWEALESRHLDTNLLLVVDASASMNEPVAGTEQTRWELLSTALVEALSEPRAEFELGLLLVPDTTGLPPNCDGAPAECCEVGPSDSLTVPIGPGEETFSQISSALEARAPGGASPLAAALERAYRHLVDADPGGVRFVVLASDGGANCNQSLECTGAQCTLQLDPSESCLAEGDTCCQDSPGGCLDDAEVTAQIERLHDAGVSTLVVGVAGNERYATALDRWATAGDLFVRPDGVERYYELSTEDDAAAFAETFRFVTVQVDYSCEIPLTQQVPNPTEVLVAVECEPIASERESGPDAQSWWIFNSSDPDSATSVILQGAVCDRILSEGVQRVDVALGCPDFGDG